MNNHILENGSYYCTTGVTIFLYFKPRKKKSMLKSIIF